MFLLQCQIYRILNLFYLHSRFRELVHDRGTSFQCGFQCPEGLVGGPRSLLERGQGKGFLIEVSG